MRTTGFHVGLGMILALGLGAGTGHAVQYDAPINVATLACPAGSTGYGNARFIVFPFFGDANWRLTIWCNDSGIGTRSHFEPGTGGVFTTWPNVASSTGVGWPPPASYTNQYQLLDIDIDGDLDVFRLVETSPNTWSVFLSKAQ